MTWDGAERRSISWDEIVAHMAMANERLLWINSTLNELSKKVGVQNGRVNKLEQWKSYIVGGAAGMGFVIGVVLTMVFKK